MNENQDLNEFDLSLNENIGLVEQSYLKAPFPYFGGKSKVASEIWKRFGNVKCYYEPFFGSGAVLLNRPIEHFQENLYLHEVINDKDGFIANVWRSLQNDPYKVATYCDWPVNHADLMARKLRLAKEKDVLLEKLIQDDKFYNPEIAGYWIWTISCSIAGLKLNEKSIPHLGTQGNGIHKLSLKTEIEENSSLFINLENNNCIRTIYKRAIYDWFKTLQLRLRDVKVICGDWTRICGGNWQTLYKKHPIGMFFDPPYDQKLRDKRLYRVDSDNIAVKVRNYCIEKSKDSRIRICLAGSYEEHQELEKLGWFVYKWNSQGGYANSKKDKSNLNKYKETLFFSPNCLKE